MKNKISIIGLGYVGLVSAVCFSKLGHKVIGVDINGQKVAMIKTGKNPLPKVQKLEGYLKKYPFEVYLGHHRKAIMNSDITFICVETPTKKNGSLDLMPLKRACRTLGQAIKKKKYLGNKRYHIFVVRSTIFPGSLDILNREIEETSGKKCGKDFDLATNPEFLREIQAVDDFFDPCYIVVGADKKEIGQRVMDCYSEINAKKFIVNNGIAQMIKYANNSWHGCKVAFTNEIALICNKAGVNADEVMKLFCEDEKLNISPYYMKPGKAYDGSCLPKDLAVLQKRGKQLGLKNPLINSISKSNEIQEEIDNVQIKLKREVKK